MNNPHPLEKLKERINNSALFKKIKEAQKNKLNSLNKKEE